MHNEWGQKMWCNKFSHKWYGCVIKICAHGLKLVSNSEGWNYVFQKSVHSDLFSLGYGVFGVFLIPKFVLTDTANTKNMRVFGLVL